MGFFPYTQYCKNGHSWGAYFCSVGNMSSTHQDTCPECGTDQVGTDSEVLKTHNMDSIDTTNVNRVEIVDHTASKPNDDNRGRVYVKWEDKLDVQLSLQDSGRTLKVFIAEKQPAPDVVGAGD